MPQRVDTRPLRIGMAQINTTVGDFTGNRQKILSVIEQARSSGVDLLTFPELAVCGYPPEDLLFKPRFIAENIKSLRKIAGDVTGPVAVVGFVDEDEKGIYNAAAVICEGKVAGVYRKIMLPNYGVFDEARYFQPGNACTVWRIAGVNVGINICEDIWFADGPPATQALAGAEVIVNISASPYHFGKVGVREEMLADRAAANKAIVAFTNMVGGQDELVFDGNSMVSNKQGKTLARGRQFAEDLIIADLDAAPVLTARRNDTRWQDKGPHEPIIISAAPAPGDKPPLPPRHVKNAGMPGEVYDALVLGTHDYITKNGFEKVLIGLSGGIDSSLVAAIAVDALGKDNVVGVAMPSRYSSAGSISDAELLSKNLGMKMLTVPIEKTFAAYLETLAEPFAGTEPGLAEENIQARIRGNILMALSNKFGWIVLTTGNKSEMATGYTTLYGDMAGGFAVIKDVPKTLAYELARYRNELAGTDLIPKSVIDKPPSAELRPDQKDEDSLPAYDSLDPILKAYVEDDESIEQIIGAGADEQSVKRAARLVDISEYKRRQAPPGVKITPRAFGRDRRLPITNRFRGV